MKRLSVLPALLLALLLSLGSLAAVKDEVVAPAVRLEVPGEGYGSGVLIRHRGELLVLTAAHVAELAVEGKEAPFIINLTFMDGRVMGGEVIRFSPDWRKGEPDLALVRPCGLTDGLQPAALVNGDPRFELGEEVFYCGFGGGFGPSLEKSIVNRVFARFIAVNGHGWFGHSGSGVFVKRRGKWVVAGVLVAFVVHPNQHPKSPLACEAALREWLDSTEGELK